MTSNVHSLREKHHHRKKSIPNHLYILKNHAKSTHTVRKLIRSPYVASKRLIHEMNHLTLRVPHVKQVETLNYRPGGFHPVHLGDQFKKDRYRVIHKLGHGGFATVWLARDLVRNRYVALKILAARLSVTCPEVEILRRLRNAPDHIGKAYVMSMLDHFWITGPNGKHLCVVSQVGGPSIKEFNDCPGQTSGSRRLQAIVARKVALQATEGLAYIHSNGTVHGDFTTANILLQLANIDEWTEEEIYERLGSPETQDLHQVSPPSYESSAPRYTINAISMKAVDAQFLSDQIMIIDFGIAFLSDSSSSDIGTPKSYCAPEFLFSKERSVNSDIWALGCTIFEIRTGSRLFRYKGRPTRTEMLETMVKEMGTLPQIYWAEWPDGRDWYKIQRKEGGELAEAKDGTLFLQIMEVGLHDGNYPATSPSGKKRKKGPEHHAVSGSESSDHDNSQGKGTTSRLIALVGEITTSEAAEVINELNNPSHGSQGSSSKDDLNPDSATSNPLSGSGSGSGSGTKNNSGSGTSNAKSGEKSISSEGISIGGSTTLAARVVIDQAENVIGDDASGARVSFKDATATAIVIEFLEPTGTRISVVEAKGLENLLRSALMYLPEERMPPSELAKHHWFFDDFKG